MDTLSNIPSHVNDTIEYMIRSDVISFYSDLMDKQATQFTILISVVSAVFVIAIGATWWWNYKGAKQQIKDEVGASKLALNKLFQSHKNAVNAILKSYENNFNGFKGSFQKSVNLQIDSKLNEALVRETEKLSLHMDEVDKHSMQEIETLKQKMLNDITEQKAELCRIFALYCNNVKAPLQSATWWIDALRNYSIVGNEEWVGRACETIVKLLDSIDVSKLDKEIYENIDDDIETIKQYIPETRQSDKRIILRKLSEIQKSLSNNE